MYVKTRHNCFLTLANSDYPDCKELVIMFSPPPKSEKKMRAMGMGFMGIILTEKNVDDLGKMFATKKPKRPKRKR